MQIEIEVAISEATRSSSNVVCGIGGGTVAFASSCD